jgi:transposase
LALWTTEMVRKLIRREFGTGLSAVSVGRLLMETGAVPGYRRRRPHHLFR